jgi:hypothetical protein
VAKLARGRHAQIYVAPVEYDEDGAVVPVVLDDMILVTRLKDISANIEAKTVTGTTRDIEYEFNAQGGKTLEITADRLIEVAEDGADYEALRDAFINDSELWVLLTRQARSSTSDDGLLFVAEMFGWPENLPEAEMVNTTLTFRPSDPDEQPVRVTSSTANGLGFLYVSELSGGDTSQIEPTGDSPENFLFQSDQTASIAIVEAFVGDDTNYYAGDFAVFTDGTTTLRAHVHSVDPGPLLNTWMSNGVFAGAFDPGDVISVRRVEQAAFITATYDALQNSGDPDSGTFYSTGGNPATLVFESTIAGAAAFYASLSAADQFVIFKNGLAVTVTVASKSTAAGRYSIVATGAVSLASFANNDVLTFHKL